MWVLRVETQMKTSGCKPTCKAAKRAWFAKTNKGEIWEEKWWQKELEIKEKK